MKKLIGFVSVVLLVCFSLVSAEEWRYLVGDNIVNDIHISGDKIYTATNGGVVVFFKDTTKRFPEGFNYKRYQRNAYGNVESVLKSNSVSTIVANEFSKFWSMGGGWLTATGDAENHLSISRVPYGRYHLARGKNGKVYAANEDGLSVVTPSGERSLIVLPHGVNRIAVDDQGTVWGISCDEGIIFCIDTAGNRNNWRCDKELVKGVPNNIAVKGDTIVVTAERGFYFKVGEASWRQIDWPMINVGYYTVRYLPIPVAISKSFVYFGAGGEVYAWDLREPNYWISLVPGGAHPKFSVVNCLAADGENLYIGTDNKMWVYDGKDLSQKAVTGIRYPHDNNILHINRAADGRTLVGGLSGGYRYDVAPLGYLEQINSAYNVLDGVYASFVDNKGAQWIGRRGYITRNDTAVNLPNLGDGGLHPYWLVKGVASSASDMWLVTGNPFSVQVYAGEGTWGNPNPLGIPAGLAKEQVLSVSSTGSRLWVATDSAVYSYDFHGKWTRFGEAIAVKRFILGDRIDKEKFWTADEVVVGGQSGPRTLWRFQSTVHRDGKTSCLQIHLPAEPNCLAEDREGIWIGTSNGAFYFDGRDLVLNPVPIDKLPDVVVNTIYVDSTTNAVWFGTAGGLTVWHRPNQATSVAPRPVGARAVPATYQNQGLVINPLGRKVSSFGHSAAGLNLLRLPNGAVVKNMNLNRLMR